MNYHHLYLELTDACNLNCKYCFVKKSKDEIPSSIVIDTLSDFTKLGGKEVTLSGGEPFLYSGLDAIIDHISVSGLNASIITNGYFSDRKMLDKLMNLGIGICISLDGTQASINDAYRGEGSFEHAIQTISYLGAYTKVAISVTPTPANIDDLYNLVEFCKKRNISTFHLSLPEIRQSGKYAFETFMLDHGSIKKLVRFIYEMLLSQDISFDLTDLGNFRRCILCKEIDLENIVFELLGNTLKIQSNGDVFLSSLTDDPFFSIGNIFENRLLSIHDNFVENVLCDMNEILKNRYLEKCRACTYLHSCYGGIVYSKGSLMDVDPYCVYRKSAFLDYIQEHFGAE